jgi:putative hydrolase of the HAD superfamily
MLNWKMIDTVLLDMDGTLLDLHYDNHFWQEFVPSQYAQQHGYTLEQAKAELIPHFKKMEGQLQWYCLDYWSENLQLDIAGLKRDVAELIAVLPHVEEFLERVSQTARSVFLVTNAHRDGLNLKLEKTGIAPYFDAIVSSHDFGYPKEHHGFWPHLQALHPFETQRTLLVDDSLAVLHAARTFGVEHLISISKPDSKRPKRVIAEFPAIEDFRALLQGL